MTTKEQKAKNAAYTRRWREKKKATQALEEGRGSGVLLTAAESAKARKAAQKRLWRAKRKAAGLPT